MASWLNYWDKQNIFDEANFRRNMRIFLRETKDFLSFESTDVVLDIGCATGALAESTKDQIKEIYCLDISNYYLDFCRHKFAKDTNVQIRPLDPDSYTQLGFLPKRKFTKIICLSVVQYYKNIDEFSSLIESIKQVAAPGAKVIIADIPNFEQNLLSDIHGNLLAAWREGYFLRALGLMIQQAFGAYREVRKAQGLFATSSLELMQITKELGVSAKVVTKHMTTNANRMHLFINL